MGGTPGWEGTGPIRKSVRTSLHGQHRMPAGREEQAVVSLRPRPSSRSRPPSWILWGCRWPRRSCPATVAVAPLTKVQQRLLELWDLPPDLYEKVARGFQKHPKG